MEHERQMKEKEVEEAARKAKETPKEEAPETPTVVPGKTKVSTPPTQEPPLQLSPLQKSLEAPGDHILTKPPWVTDITKVVKVGTLLVRFSS